ncbi:acetylornithine deacetylase [Marinobacter daepoensis]|uniref:Acetylornithine deacetylase n=1 Tax=Marinobacter daepoensis TaxID=262077 RepID=A0ABS3BFI4_9GAMM|nr:acetylornithine deacetylase [Marinobacter daepoensis]MBN7770278.1 acetylornithine deacetylase [Marinobacter daepoensis]MBY6079724.1 acetylornithine deacetylase [Marinobacter daepoensis]
MKRLLSFLILTGIVVFAGFKAGVWWLMDQRLSEARAALSETGVLEERGGISSSLDGRVIVRKARWEDFRLTQPLQLGLVELETGSPVTLLTTLLNPESLPVQWRLSVEQASINLEPTMFRNWVTAAPDEAAQVPLTTLSCAPDPRQQISSGDLMRMGVPDIRGDLVLEQTPGALRLELNTRETGSLELTWPDARLTLGNLNTPAALGPGPVRLTLRDAGLMRRMSAYCARETGLEVSAWAGRGVVALEAGLRARALEASPQLLALYRQWLMEGGELSLSLSPASEMLGLPVRPNQEEGADWEVTYNGAGVPDVFLTPIQQVAPEPPAKALEPVVPPEDPEVEQWYPDTVERAGDWLGHRVRVTLSNDNDVEGRLVSVGERDLEIARTVAGGEVAYPILMRAITQFEVWRRGRPE